MSPPLNSQLSLSPLCPPCDVVPASQDHILPYMADDRHAPDTLFFVVEEDWRLFKRHSEVSPQVMSDLAATAYAASSSAMATRGAAFQHEVNQGVLVPVEELFEHKLEGRVLFGDGTQLFGPPAAGTDSWKLLFGGFYARPTKPSAAEVEASKGASSHVEDLVKICTAAHRQGRGDLVWLSWDGAEKKGSKIKVCHAATLIAVSARGAKKLNTLVQEGSLGAGRHWDLMLIDYLRKHGNDFGASFIWPSVGHYQDHESQSSDREGWRSGQWAKSWVQEGTRVEQASDQVRWLVHFGEKNVDWMRRVDLPEKNEEDLRWFTHLPAEMREAAELVAAAQKEEAEARAGRAAGRGKGKGKGKCKPVYLKDAPVFAVTSMRGQDVPQTRRQKRQRRGNLNVYWRYRVFAEDEDKVVKTNQKTP